MVPASITLRISSSGTGSGVKRRIARAVYIASNRSVVVGMNASLPRTSGYTITPAAMYRTWAQFYQSDAQSVYAPWIAPTLFLAYWLLGRATRRGGVEPRAFSFMNVYAPLFAIETMIDPYAT